MSKKYTLPTFLDGILTQDAYLRWLGRKAVAHVKRDRARGNASATREAYMISIHAAVILSNGFDEYTGECLRWDLVSTYDNNQSQAGRRQYKQAFSLLPTVDHVDDGLGLPNFRICSWRVNDAKNDLSLDEFVKLCQMVVAHSNRLGEFEGNLP